MNYVCLLSTPGDTSLYGRKLGYWILFLLAYGKQHPYILWLCIWGPFFGFWTNFRNNADNNNLSKRDFHR